MGHLATSSHEKTYAAQAAISKIDKIRRNAHILYKQHVKEF